MKACDFIGVLFLARDVAHSVHLNTRSYSKHKAYQGRYGLIGPITLNSAKKTPNIIEFLQGSLAEIEGARYNLCDKTDSALQQLIDNIVEIYLRTLYKLRFLA